MAEAGAGDEELMQYSMPLYFDHMFGTSIGFSQHLEKPTPRSSSSSSRYYQPASVILESQGFHHKVSTGDEAGTESSKGSCPLISAQDTSHPSTKSPASSQSSIILFSSPDITEYEDTPLQSRINDLSTPNIPKSTHTSNGSCKLGTDAAPSMRSRKRRHSEVECEYHCPPSCCALGQCISPDRTVNMIAVVVQGQ